MHFLNILTVFLEALVYACPPPFNSFDFVGNDTHTTADLVSRRGNTSSSTAYIIVGGCPLD
jgi:hypothetical protein